MPLQLLHEPVGAALRPGEDEDEAALLLEQLDQRLDLVVGRDRDELVIGLAALEVRRELGVVAARVERVRAGELTDLAVERGREEHRLALAGQALDDRVDLRLEAHVEHAVGLVEDEDPDRVELEQLPLGQVLEPARRGDDDVRVLRLLRVGHERRAAVDRGDPQALRLGERRELLCDLGRELARRHEDERGGLRLGGVQALDDRDREGEGLARPGRRLLASRSCPFSPSGMTSVWMAKGDSTPRRESASTTHRPRQADEMTSYGCSTPWFGVRDLRPETPEGGTRSEISLDDTTPSVQSG